MYQSQNSVLGIGNNIDNKLKQETNILAQIAANIYDLDLGLAKSAEALDGSVQANINNELTKIINSNIEIELDMTQISFEGTNLLGDTGKICMSDISSMYEGGTLTGKLKSNFDSERTNAQNMKNEIDGFTSLISDKSKFQGELWDQVATKYNAYSELLQKRIDASDKLEEAYIKALELITNYMAPDDELDDSEIPELEQKVADLEQEIIYNQEIMSEKITVVDEYGEHLEYKYSKAERLAAEENISVAKYAITEFKEKIEKLKRLPEIMNQAEAIITAALEEIYADYGKAVEAITVGGSPKITAINTDKTNLPVYSANAEKFGVDISNFSDNAIDIFNEVSDSWPADIAPGRVKEIVEALNMLDKGIVYDSSVSGRIQDNSADCSSFAARACCNAGMEGLERNMTTNNFASRYNDKANANSKGVQYSEYFSPIAKMSETQLEPGDFVFYYNKKTASTGNSNHVGIFIGYNKNNQPQYIECSSRFKEEDPSAESVQVTSDKRFNWVLKYNNYETA